MEFKTIYFNEIMPGAYAIQFNRPRQKNSINAELIQEISIVLDVLAEDEDCKMIVLEGSQGYFCTGMDFEGYVGEKEEQTIPLPEEFMSLLKQISEMPQIIIAKLEGKVMAGGVGLAAVCDYVLASEKTTFLLSEMLWGLLPCMVLPYIIRRTGYWQAYQMTISATEITAKEALLCHLADEVSDDLENSIKTLYKRFARLNSITIGEAKQYFKKLWIINEEMELEAVEEITKLADSELVRKNITCFVKEKKFPWQL